MLALTSEPSGMATHLTPHFTFEELIHSQTAGRKGFHNVPPTSSPEYKNLQRLAETMEKVRSLLGDNPILVSSGYRSPQLNKAVGGSKGSWHTRGLAIDFTCPDFGTPLIICKVLEPCMEELEIDQLIYEFGSWVHLGLAEGRPPRHMTLTIDKKGERSGFA